MNINRLIRNLFKGPELTSAVDQSLSSNWQECQGKTIQQKAEIVYKSVFKDSWFFKGSKMRAIKSTLKEQVAIEKATSIAKLVCDLSTEYQSETRNISGQNPLRFALSYFTKEKLEQVPALSKQYPQLSTTEIETVIKRFQLFDVHLNNDKITDNGKITISFDSNLLKAKSLCNFLKKQIDDNVQKAANAIIRPAKSQEQEVSRVSWEIPVPKRPDTF